MVFSEFPQDISCGLIGGKLSHSLSPQIHRLFGSRDYRLFELPDPDAVAGFMLGMREGRYPPAVNVTIPHKREVMRHLDCISPLAAKLGAVNTVVLKNGRLCGYVTDPAGFGFMLDAAGIEVGGRKCLCLGTGGASKSVAEVLMRRNASEVIMISRSGDDNYENIYRHRDARVIVNATPVGMYPHNGEKLFDLGEFHLLESCADLIYNPAVTPFLADAARCGCRTANGLAMLVAQAKRSREIFAGTSEDEIRNFDPDETAGILDVTERIRREMISVGLVGMPGSGKTSVGKRLAQITGREFIDTDDMIVGKAGMSIPEIFASQGEDAFRDIESECVAEASKRGGCVIAYGGGAVLRERNRMLMRQNSFVAWLDRPAGLLSRKGRPLSGGRSDEEMEKMYAERCAAYDAASDARIICAGGAETIESAAGRIMMLTGIPEKNDE